MAQFQEAYAAGRVHHGWLITGPQGIGKASLAYYLARIILGAEDFSSPAGRRVTAGTHGDLLEISRQYDSKKDRLKSEITVADVQPIQSFFHQTAGEGGWRVVIIDGAEYLNRFAANALLKILEEPPAKAILFLTTSSPGMLLPTLKSRCRLLALSPLSDENMRRLLPTIEETIIKRSHGSPGRALFLSQGQNSDIEALVDKLARGDIFMTGEVWQFTAKIARDNKSFTFFFDQLSEALAIEAKKHVTQGDLAQAALIAQKLSDLQSLWQKTDQLNLDKTESIREAFALIKAKDYKFYNV
nr:AAA family ATPase [Aristophania vespae]